MGLLATISTCWAKLTGMGSYFRLRWTEDEGGMGPQIILLEGLCRQDMWGHLLTGLVPCFLPWLNSLLPSRASNTATVAAAALMGTGLWT